MTFETSGLTAYVNREYVPVENASVSIFEKTEVSCALQPDRSPPEPTDPANQLILFNF